MKTDKCPGCGATKFINNSNGDIVCQYCNTTISLKTPEPEKVTTNSSTDIDTDSIKSYDILPNLLAGDCKKRPKISVFVAILLFFFAPPVAIFYIISKASRQSAWDKLHKNDR